MGPEQRRRLAVDDPLRRADSDPCSTPVQDHRLRIPVRPRSVPVENAVVYDESEGDDRREEHRRKDAGRRLVEGRVPKHREPGEHPERRHEAEVDGRPERELHEADECGQREEEEDRRLPDADAGSASRASTTAPTMTPTGKSDVVVYHIVSISDQGDGREQEQYAQRDRCGDVDVARPSSPSCGWRAGRRRPGIAKTTAAGAAVA